jgi:hypothetical protein
MSTSKRSIKNAATKVAKARGLSVQVVQKAIVDAMRLGKLEKGFSFLSFAGILPVTLPDGCKLAVLPDIHVPAHHKKIWWSVLQFLKDYQPDIVVVIGDVADVFGASAWPADPGVFRNLQDELDQTRRLLDQIKEVSGCYWIFVVMGNHEDRLWRYMTNVAPHLANVVDAKTRERIVSIPGLLGYGPDDNITFLFDLAERGGFGGGIVVNDDMEFHHGFIVRPVPGASPRADADRTGRSTTHGHTHRAGFSVRETTEGHVAGFELGHLTDPTHAYLAYANLLNNWHPAIGVATVVGGTVHMEVLPIRQVTMADGQLRHIFAFDGKEYVSSDR